MHSRACDATFWRNLLLPPRLSKRYDGDKTYEDKNNSSYETYISTYTRIQGATPPKTVVFTAIGVTTPDIVETDCILLCLRVWSSSPLVGTRPLIHYCVPNSPPLPSLGSEGNTNGPPLSATQAEHTKHCLVLQPPLKTPAHLEMHSYCQSVADRSETG